MLPFPHDGGMQGLGVDPEEGLRQALVELQKAQRAYAAAFSQGVAREEAAHAADDARVQAAQWGALVRAAAENDE